MARAPAFQAGDAGSIPVTLLFTSPQISMWPGPDALDKACATRCGPTDEFPGAHSSHSSCVTGAGAGLHQEGSTMNTMARRMFELVEPIGVIPYSADEP